MEFTPIPQQELDIFKSLRNVRVVFDVGARTDTDYINIKPNAEYHLFEPNLDFAEELKKKVQEQSPKSKVYINDFGLGDTPGEFAYNFGRQAFTGGELGDLTEDRLAVIKTLDSYIQEHQIKKIDFLKIDTESYDFKVLLGGREAIRLCRYIQYEYWDNKQQFHDLLEDNFIMCYIGQRNVLCIRKGEKWL